MIEFDNIRAFTAQLKTLRQQQGIKQSDFSPLLSQQYISEVEQGKRFPSFSTCQGIARRLGYKLTLRLSKIEQSQPPTPSATPEPGQNIPPVEQNQHPNTQNGAKNTQKPQKQPQK